jgi:hypothetical protein
MVWTPTTGLNSGLLNFARLHMRYAWSKSAVNSGLFEFGWLAYGNCLDQKQS